MPLFKILSNTTVSDKEAFLKKASKTIADILGKSEKFVMVIFQNDQNMIFSGSTEPAMFIELKSIGLPREKTGEISAVIMEFLHHETGVTPGRMFIEFSSVDRDLWGWNSGTI
jgi:phenylpyruvate tautomerase